MPNPDRKRQRYLEQLRGRVQYARDGLKQSDAALARIKRKLPQLEALNAQHRQLVRDAEEALRVAEAECGHGEQ